MIVDHWGIIKADVGLRDGKIVALGKAGNPDIMDGVHPDLVIGPETEIIAGNGKILTAGAVDTHVHFVDPQVIPEALGSGVTTLIGGGAGPGEGSKATTVTPGAWYLARMFEALDAYPVNIGLTGKGSTVNKGSMRDQLRAGALGFKIHEDWGATPAAIRAALEVCCEDGVGAQLALHADTLNEAGYLESTLDAIAGRGIHVYHAEGAGAGTPRTSSRLPRTAMCCRPRPTRASRTPTTRQKSTSTWSWSPTISNQASRTTRHLHSPGSGRPPCSPKTSCTTWARCR